MNLHGDGANADSGGTKITANAVGRTTTEWFSSGTITLKEMVRYRFTVTGTITANWVLFQIALFIVFTMYGGGFATIPAFLADIFGPENVGAIHGALLTAWSAAAVAGPVIITELSNRAKAALPPGADRIHIYDTPLQVLAGLLAIGFLLTLIVRPLRPAPQVVAGAPVRSLS